MINKSFNYIYIYIYIYKAISSYCLKYRKNTESKNPKVLKAKNRRIMLLSICNSNSKKSKFIKEQQARGLLSHLTGVKVPILCDLPVINTLF